MDILTLNILRRIKTRYDGRSTPGSSTRIPEDTSGRGKGKRRSLKSERGLGKKESKVISVIIQRLLALSSLSHRFLTRKKLYKILSQLRIWLSQNLTKCFRPYFATFCFCAEIGQHRKSRKMNRKKGLERYVAPVSMCGRGRGVRTGNFSKDAKILGLFISCGESIRKQIRPSCKKILRLRFVLIWFRGSCEILETGRGFG